MGTQMIKITDDSNKLLFIFISMKLHRDIPWLFCSGELTLIVNLVNLIAVHTPHQSSQPKSDQLAQATAKEIVDHLTPEFQKHMDLVALFPRLQCHPLVSLADAYMLNPHVTVVSKSLGILECESSKGLDDFERFVQCLSEGTEHAGHTYLAGRLHKGMEEREYEAHMDMEMDQVGIGNKLHGMQSATRAAISMQQGYLQYKLRKQFNETEQQTSRNAVRDTRIFRYHDKSSTVVMDNPFNYATRARLARISKHSSVQPNLLLESIDQQLAAASPLVSMCWIYGE